MSTTPLQSQRSAKESGMVAIMVTLILMIVISLIVLGFAQISRRNQRQALDRQLSTQAFYAAETGVNDVAEILKGVAPGQVIPEKDICGPDGSPFYVTLDPVIDEDNEVEYTCLLVDPTPDELSYGDVGDPATIIPVVAESGTIGSIRLTWSPLPTSEPTAPPPTQFCPITTTNVFNPTDDWDCGYGVFRFDLVPTSGNLTIDGLRNATMTTFVVPLRAGAGVASVNYSTGGANSRLGVVCSNTQCRLTINFLAPGAQYHMRVNSIYKHVSLVVQAYTGINATGDVVSLRDAQTLVDATGKAQDVLRRIQVRIPVAGSSTNPATDYALQSHEAICKRFAVMDGFYTSDANTVVPGVGDDATSTNNPLCDTR